VSDTANFYEYLCRTCGHHERKHAGYPLACVACDSHNLLRTPLFREPKPGEYDIWARDQHIEVLKAEVERLRAALDDLGAFEWRYVVPPDSDGTNDALCLRCQGRGRTIRAIIHRDTCPYAVLNEEPPTMSNLTVPAAIGGRGR